MQVTATAKFVRNSPRKARLLLPTINGLPAEEALLQLQHRPHASAKPIAKLISSAVANAEHNHSLDKRDLVVESVTVDQGPTFKRYKPVSRGRSQNIRRKTVHLKVVLRGVESPDDKKTTRTKKATKKVTDTAKKIIKKQAEEDSAPEVPKTTSKATDVKTAKHEPQTPNRAEVKQVVGRKTGRQTGRGKQGS
ncbi:50S ribosomal protein L22 [Patescibacteria group bacterium]|nr:50S ribosomal protein L22 [Patescibacteria group bacterium]